MGNSIRVAFALFLFLIIVGCSTEKSEQDNILSQMGPPTDSLSLLSDSRIDSLLQSHSNRQDIVAESYRRKGNVDPELSFAMSSQSNREWLYLGDSASAVFPTVALYGLKPEPVNLIAIDPLDESILLVHSNRKQIIRCVKVMETECECSQFTVPEPNGMGIITDIEVDDAQRLLWVVSKEPDMIIAFSLWSGRPQFRTKPVDSATSHHFSGLLIFSHDSVLIAATNTNRIFLFDKSDYRIRLKAVMRGIPLPTSLARNDQTGTIFVSSKSKGICQLETDFSGFHKLERKGIVMDGGIRKLVCRGSNLAAFHEGYGATRLVKYELDSTENVVLDAQGVELEFHGDAIGGIALANSVVYVLYYPKSYHDPSPNSHTNPLPQVRASLLL